MSTRIASIAFIIFLTSLTSCHSAKLSCSSPDVQSLVTKHINKEIESIFSKRPILNPNIILNNTKILLNDIVLEADNTQQLTCSATIKAQIPHDTYNKLIQPQIQTTFNNFGHMGDAKISENGIVSTINYKVKLTEDTQKTIITSEQEPAVARALWVSAMLGVW